MAGSHCADGESLAPADRFHAGFSAASASM